MKDRIKKVIRFITNPRLLLCCGIAWIITNGWAYILLGIGMLFDIEWMTAVSGGYLAILWLPISPEKIITVAIAIALLSFLFPDDKNTLAVLKQMQEKVKEKIKPKKKEQKDENSEQSE